MGVIIHIDTETRSAVDARKQGFDALAKDCEIDIVTWGVSPDIHTMPTEVKGWDSLLNPTIPDELHQLLSDPENWFVAFNAGFDETVLERAKNIPGYSMSGRWLDSGATAAAISITVSTLEATAKVMQCQHQKVELLPGLMKLFCGAKLYGTAKTYRGRALYKGQEIDQAYFTELRNAYMEYAIEDTWTSAEIFTKANSYGEPLAVRDYQLHQEINRRGIGVDMAFVSRVIKLSKELKEKGKEELRDLCHLIEPVDYDVASHQGFAKWLDHTIEGWEDRGSSKDVVMMLAAEREEQYGERDGIAMACKLKVAVTGTADAKFQKIKETTCKNTSRLYQALRFNGASRTGRPTGSGAQMLNLARPKKMKTAEEAVEWSRKSADEWVEKFGAEAPEIIAKTERASFIPAPGYVYVDFDFSSIESVILVETTQDPVGVDIRRKGLDPYIAFGTKMFDMTYEEIVADKKAGGTVRQKSKPPVLGCGYGLSGPGLQDYAKGMGMYVTLDFAVKSVDVWRDTHTVIVKSWEYMETLFKGCLGSAPGTIVPISDLIPNNPAVLERHSNAVVMRLPCGRGIWYLEPRVEPQVVPYRDKVTGEPKTFVTQSFTYADNKGGKRYRTGTHGGKLTGNFCQATGNSLLREWMRNVDDAGLAQVLHVYDQVLLEVPESQAEYAAQKVIECIPANANPSHWSASWDVKADGGIINRFWK